ncbi:hypothetical protein FEM03_12050 [Phragmitibacter flavus]|uniref:Uncharacterized protein n=1 Tax=Phragmitibacter flavus TaxID=2576071 RepID=A0A5R8KDS6_9BACT|nr:hypothetical protein [Phragmitibacter flavus]TLD70454.1 hypothetical protein FEM03_12050 [Phragmitibacter flavus]
MPGEPAKPKRRSRWRRLFRWAAWTSVLAILLLMGSAWMAYVYRVSLTNRALTYLEPYEITVGTVDLSGEGRVNGTDLVVKDRLTGGELLRLPLFTVHPGWRELLEGKIGELVLDHPQVDIGEAQLRRWLQASPDDVPNQAPPAPFYVGGITIKDALIKLRMNDDTAVELKLNYEGEQLVRDAAGMVNSGLQRLVIEDGRVNAGNGEPPFSVQHLELKGQVQDGVLKLANVEIRESTLHLTPTLMSLFASRESATLPPVVDVAADPAPPMIRGIEVNEIRVEGLAFKADGFDAENKSGVFLPDIRGTMNGETSALRWELGGQLQTGPQQWHLERLAIETPENAGHVRIPQIEWEIETLQDLKRWQFKKLLFKQPEIAWTKTLRESFLAKSDEVPPIVADPVAAAPWEIEVADGGIEKAEVRLEDEALMSFHLNADASLEVKALRINQEGWQSASPQVLTVINGLLQFPEKDGEPGVKPKPFFELPFGELAMIPDRWNKDFHVQKLVLRKPSLLMRDGNTPWLAASKTTAPAAPADQDQEEPKTESPWWQKLNFDELTLAEGVSDLLVLAPEPVEARGNINITTLDLSHGKVQKIRLDDVEARLPTLSRLPFPVANFSSFEGTVKLSEMWTKRRIESMRLEGASLEAGDALMGLIDSNEKAAAAAPVLDEPARTAPAAPKAESGRPWHVGQLDITQSSITIANLVPGLPAVKFNLEFHATNSPLLAEDLTRNLASQRIELANLTIPSPYEPLRAVAELDSIFVHFTLQGLMNKQIDKIEVVSPTLYVGEDLFWYVDYYRKYVSKGAESPPGGAQMVTDDEAFALKAASALIDAEPTPAEAAWSIRQLQIHSGKLILAPKGKPLKGFGKPLPFDINTEVVRGTLEAELQIPADVYTLDEYKLQLEGMHGSVRFNLPLKDKDNNLVETFEVDRIRWKELQTGKAYLTITYDAAGIYAKFGAEAYEGYVNGEVNVYNDDTYSWDGWIGGKKVQTNELTQKLFPTYFFMQGNVDATLVAQGNMHELFQADGNFKNDSPGKFSITALNDAVKSLPGDWTQLEKQMTQIGLETLRDFEYDQAAAEFRLYGREGKGEVRFTGPHGSRNFDINVYDHRWTADDKPLTTTE